jgi:aromatase
MPALHRTEHRLVVSAPADQLYALVADVTRWPAVFEPNLHVHHLERGERQERFRLWALLNGTVKSWTSRRELDPAQRTVSFEQEVSQPPVASMGGQWRLEPLPDGRTEVVLLHHFSVVGDDPDTVDWINRAVDGNSEKELAALRAVAERADNVDDVVFSFEDLVRSSGSAADCYEFVNRADKWAERLPHVDAVSLREDEPGIQELSMDTVTEGGATHTTRSYRICESNSWIAYKQVVLPALLSGHSGLWTFREDSGTTTVTARHTVSIQPEAIEEVLGAGSTLADARRFVRSALGNNSLTTLKHASEFAAGKGDR